MGGVCLHVSLTRFVLIAITVRARLGAKALDARKRHLARKADLIRCWLS
jgi:hypothetical protein